MTMTIEQYGRLAVMFRGGATQAEVRAQHAVYAAALADYPSDVVESVVARALRERHRMPPAALLREWCASLMPRTTRHIVAHGDGCAVCGGHPAATIHPRGTMWRYRLRHRADCALYDAAVRWWDDAPPVDDEAED